ncbi:radical SAM protein [bacterium]
MTRYSLTKKEILNSANQIYKDNIQTVVLQSGETNDLDINWLADIIKTIKNKYSEMAITLSIGEKTFQEYEILKRAGADRYLLKMETYDKNLYEFLHPDLHFEDKLESLDELKKLNFQVGSGNIIGFQNQSIESIANDIINFKTKNYDMVSISPFIPHPNTPLAGKNNLDIELILKTIALSRIVTKKTHIPATTALGSIGKDYRIDALKVGANVIMPNYTPVKNRKLYEIYPNKRCIDEPLGMRAKCLERLAHSIGRKIASGRGDSVLNS